MTADQPPLASRQMHDGDKHPWIRDLNSKVALGILGRAGAEDRQLFDGRRRAMLTDSASDDCPAEDPDERPSGVHKLVVGVL